MKLILASFVALFPLASVAEQPLKTIYVDLSPPSSTFIDTNPDGACDSAIAGACVGTILSFDAKLYDDYDSGVFITEIGGQGELHWNRRGSSPVLLSLFAQDG